MRQHTEVRISGLCTINSHPVPARGTPQRISHILECMIGDYVDLCNGVEDIMTNSQNANPLPPPPSPIMRDIQHNQPFPGPAHHGPGLVIYAAG